MGVDPGSNYLYSSLERGAYIDRSLLAGFIGIGVIDVDDPDLNDPDLNVSASFTYDL